MSNPGKEKIIIVAEDESGGSVDAGDNSQTKGSTVADASGDTVAGASGEAVTGASGEAGAGASGEAVAGASGDERQSMSQLTAKKMARKIVIVARGTLGLGPVYSHSSEEMISVTMAPLIKTLATLSPRDNAGAWSCCQSKGRNERVCYIYWSHWK